MIKYPKVGGITSRRSLHIFDDDYDLIVIEEKMDGANMRFMVNDGKIIFGSRNVEFNDDKDISDRFRRAVDFVREKLKDKDLSKYNGYVFFGECMVRHTLDYDWDRIPPILMFDVWDGEKFLDYNEKIKIFDELNLPIVPLVRIDEVRMLKNEKIDDDFVPNSAWRSGKAEGVVFKNYKKQIFAKYARSEFKERKLMSFKKSKNKAKDDNERVVLEYCTNPRIEKKIFELIDRGEKLDMALMKYLPKMVWDDIIEENGEDILRSNYVLDLKKIRKLISKKCLHVLESMIENNKW